MADSARSATYTVTVDGIGPVPVNVTERGEGRPYLLLHGGAGPQSVDGFAALLASSGPARVLTPLHPGFGGTPRPEALDSMSGLARLYAQLIADLGLTGVTVIGNTIGGWIAAEIALLNSPQVSGVILVDAAGLKIDAYPSADFFSLTMDQVAELSYFNPDAFRIDLDSLPPAAKEAMAANRAALAVYGGTEMADPSLLVQHFRDIRDLIASGQPPSDEAVEGVMARYATEPATDYAPYGTGRDQRPTEGKAEDSPHKKCGAPCDTCMREPDIGW